MRHPIRTTTLLSCLLALLGPAGSARQGGQAARVAASAEPRLEALELVTARPFVLDEPFTHHWREERPRFRGGLLLVLRGSPGSLAPRQGLEPVLFAGGETVERLNDPTPSGHLIALVPAPVNEREEVVLDLTRTPIWLGTPELPERVDAARARTELARAVAEGLPPARRAAPARGRTHAPGVHPAGATVYLRDRDQLDLIVADLVEAYSPEELQLIAGLRLPLDR